VTPRRLDRRTVQSRLELMRVLLDRLEKFGDVDRATVESLDDRLILERILTQLVDLAVSINTQVVAAVRGRVPDAYGPSFLALGEIGVLDPDLARALAPATGLRNVLVRAYLDVDMDRFVSAVPLARTQFAAYVRQVAAWLLSSGSAPA
jgi:uncharacterized protein YutE (UPF0331/DUF86 family)